MKGLEEIVSIILLKVLLSRSFIYKRFQSDFNQRKLVVFEQCACMVRILNYYSAIIPDFFSVCHVIQKIRVRRQESHGLWVTEETRHILGYDTFKVF